MRIFKILIFFNLVFIPVLALSFFGAAYIVRRQLEESAEQQVLENSRVMMQTARASRLYTTKQVAPLLDHEQSRVDKANNNVFQILDMQLPAAVQKAIDRIPQPKDKQVVESIRQQILDDVRQAPRELPGTEFFPQSIPFYGSTENFNYFRGQYPNYSYKEAALNPTNPRDRTVDWEADVVNIFRNDPARTEVTGHRGTPDGASLYFSAPIRVDDASCLTCHSTPETAPVEMVKFYGTANGFGWKLNDVIGAQIVSVPANWQTHPPKGLSEPFCSGWVVSLDLWLSRRISSCFHSSAGWRLRAAMPDRRPLSGRATRPARARKPPPKPRPPMP
jgi:hypothetical protein